VALELDPEQPVGVAAAIEQLLAAEPAALDAWWTAGLAEALRGGDGPAAEDAGGGAGVVEP
jgi:hypothetical protein